VAYPPDESQAVSRRFTPARPGTKVDAYHQQLRAVSPSLCGKCAVCAMRLYETDVRFTSLDGSFVCEDCHADSLLDGVRDCGSVFDEDPMLLGEDHDG
jgi:hypothetical protein